MRHFLSLAVFLTALVAPAVAQTNLQSVDVDVDSKKVKVRVSTVGDPTLAALALQAFGVHGRYLVVASDYAFDIKFTALGSNQVRADVFNRAGAVVNSQAFTGTTIYNALLRAADFAVEKTNGLGLKGFFTSRLAFISQASGKTEVWTSDLFFTSGSVQKVTSFNAQALMPRWSPDGTEIAFTSYKTGVPDIYILNLVSLKFELVASYQGTNIAGPFSPDGGRLAMTLTSTGRPEIWVKDLRTGAMSQKTKLESVKSSPVWSPDGNQIIFAMEPGPQLYRMSAAGSSPQKINTNSRVANEPTWSRASPNKVAFTFLEGTRNRIGVADLSTGTAKGVSPPSLYGMQPSWLPDGRHLVYTVQTGSRSVLHILDTELPDHSVAISKPGAEPASQANVWAP